MQSSGLRDGHTQIQPAKRTGSMDQYSDGKSEETVSEAAAAMESPGRIPYPHLLDLELEDEEKAGGKWHLYHTPTGRLTGFLRERQKYNCTEQKDPGRKSPWKPPYTSPIHRPMHPVGTDSPTTIHKRGTVANSSADMAVKTSEALSQKFIHTTHNAEVSGFTYQCGTYNQPRRTATVGGPSHALDQGRSSSPGTLENEQTCFRGREMLKEGAEMRLKALTLAKRNDVSRQECQEQVLEHRYLQFVAEVTRDIMSRNVLSRPALDLLCKMHVDRHKHSLREDEMLRRLDELKTRIGIS